MLGSNADLPIVGGSILTHDHYQGGRHHFPMEDAKVIKSYEHDQVQVDMLYWPLSTLRLTSTSKEKLLLWLMLFLRNGLIIVMNH